MCAVVGIEEKVLIELEWPNDISLPYAEAGLEGNMVTLDNTTTHTTDRSGTVSS